MLICTEMENLQLMAVLYPVTLVVSVLISMGVALLMVLQGAREAAIMRVLGMGRLRARVLLSSEQFLLSLLGIMAGLAALVFADREVFLQLTNAYVFCAALYFAGSILGATFGAISVTNRMPLGLLQVKE
jgi:ABC-type antimicrobial peptide transport system permease subunit